MSSLKNTLWRILEPLDEDPFQDLLLKRPEIAKNLTPKFEDLYDPFLMKNMDLAVQRIFQAIESNEKILIHGDYDVDGIIASVVLYEALLEIKNQKSGVRDTSERIQVFLPHRIEDGYGLNIKNLQKFKDQGVNLIITVDNGISAVDEVAEAKRLGMDVLITDHHNVPEILPDTLILNPKQPGDLYPFKGLVGAGVAYKLAVAAFESKAATSHESTFLEELLGLVAIATVVDCGDLVDENRTLVTIGLQELQKTKRPSLIALYQIMGIDPKNIGVYTLGFQIGPRLNASGRIDTPMLGFELLRENDPVKAQERASILNSLNMERQDILARALEEAEASKIENDTLILCKNPEWHIGVIGLIAGKLAEKYHKPCFALTKRDECLVGSIRNPLSTIDITDFLNEHAQLFEHFGGHRQAAGFSLPIEHWETFIEAMQGSATKHILPEYLQKVLTIDSEIHKPIVLPDVLSVQSLAPFGLGNREPRFLLSQCQILGSQSFGKEQEHFKCILLFQGESIEGVAFREAAWKPLLQDWKCADIVGKLSINEWNGKKKLQMIIEDMRKTKV